MMIWLECYLILGAASFLALWWHGRKGRDESTLYGVLQRMRSPQSWREQFTEKVLVPLMAGIVVLLGWPVVLWAAWREKRLQKKQELRQQEAIFRVRQADLLQQTTPEDVERTERVQDALGAVPVLPFGHLHRVWQKFLDARPEQAQLWSFEALHVGEWGYAYRRQGYVWVTEDQPQAWMLTFEELQEAKNE